MDSRELFPDWEREAKVYQEMLEVALIYQRRLEDQIKQLGEEKDQLEDQYNTLEQVDLHAATFYAMVLKRELKEQQQTIESQVEQIRRLKLQLAEMEGERDYLTDQAQEM